MFETPLWQGVSPLTVAIGPLLAMGMAARELRAEGYKRRSAVVLWRAAGLLAVAGVLDWLCCIRWVPGLIADMVILAIGVCTLLLQMPRRDV